MNRLYAVLYPLIWIFMRIFHPWKAEGRENVPEGAVVMCGNHTTLGDPIYVVCALGWRCQTRIIAKEELMKIPVLGFLLGKAGIGCGRHQGGHAGAAQRGEAAALP